MEIIQKLIVRQCVDRFLVLNEWEGHFSGAVQCVLHKPVSDHFPILLDGGGVRSGPMPFRFENMWSTEEGFKKKMQPWWVGLNFSGSASIVLATKLKALKPLIREWNKLDFAKVEVNKALALNQVDLWDKVELSRPLFVQEVDARRGAKEDFKKWALLEEIVETGILVSSIGWPTLIGRGTCYPGSK